MRKIIHNMYSEQSVALRAILASVISAGLILGFSNAFQFPSNTYAQSSPLRVALLTDALFSDGGWGATAYNSSQALKEKYGLELTTVENVAIPDIEPTLRDFADQGNNLIIAQGFEWGDPALRVGADYPDTKITGQYIDTFTDPARGKEAGVSLINNGADFLIHVADLSGQGVIQAAKEKGIYALGVVADQHNLAPDTVLTSFVLDMEKAFDGAIRMVQNGNFSGQLYKPGLESAKGASGDGIVFIAPFYNLDSKVPTDVKQRLNQIVQDIISGKIVVPERTEASS